MPRKGVKKITKAQMMKLMHGSGFFGDLWSKFKSGVSSAVKKPSTWLGAAGMLPTPLAPLLKAGSVVSGLTGNGKRRKPRAKKVGGRRPRVASSVLRM